MQGNRSRDTTPEMAVLTAQRQHPPRPNHCKKGVDTTDNCYITRKDTDYNSRTMTYMTVSLIASCIPTRSSVG